jgi:hypothetical protein
MEQAEKEKKEYKRITDFDRNWKSIRWVGKLTVLFGIFFMLMGVYVYFQIIPRFSGPQGSPVEDLKIAYSLWCYTFVLLGLCTFITGYLLVSYCRDVHFLCAFRNAGKCAEVPAAEQEEKSNDRESREKEKGE